MDSVSSYLRRLSQAGNTVNEAGDLLFEHL